MLMDFAGLVIVQSFHFCHALPDSCTKSFAILWGKKARKYLKMKRSLSAVKQFSSNFERNFQRKTDFGTLATHPN